MNYDEYNEVINGELTFKNIAENLKNGVSTLIGWSDEEYTHYDILFTYGTDKYGNIQGGIKYNDLFVSIMRIGTFGFKIDQAKYPTYIAEKLFHNNLNNSVEKVTELINGVLLELNRSDK